MSDAPETIYTSAMGKWLVDDATPRWPSDVKYRRADLPPTLEAAMQLPEVRALVEVARMASEHYLDIAFHREGDVLRAALAPFDDDLNAAKALQTELARVICDAVNSMFNTDRAE